MALNVRFMQKAGIEPAEAVTGMGLNVLAGGVVHAVLLVLFVAWAGQSSSGFKIPASSKVLVFIVILLAILGIVVATRWGRHLIRTKVFHFFRESWRSLVVLSRSPLKLAMLFGGSAGVTLAYISALAAAVAAFGGGVSLRAGRCRLPGRIRRRRGRADTRVVSERWKPRSSPVSPVSGWTRAKPWRRSSATGSPPTGCRSCPDGSASTSSNVATSSRFPSRGGTLRMSASDDNVREPQRSDEGSTPPSTSYSWRAVAITFAVAAAILAISTAIVHSGKVSRLEADVFHAINDLPGFLEPVMYVFQLLGILFVPLVVAIVAALYRKWWLTLCLVLVIPLKLFFEKKVIKEIVDRQRPGTSICHGDLTCGHFRGDVSIRGESFVSGHAIITGAVATLLFFYLGRTGRIVVIGLAVMNGVAACIWARTTRSTSSAVARSASASVAYCSSCSTRCAGTPAITRASSRKARPKRHDDHVRHTGDDA